MANACGGHDLLAVGRKWLGALEFLADHAAPVRIGDARTLETLS